MNPTISVILPFFNSSRTLGQSVDSILNQDFEDFELLLIDDNSDLKPLYNKTGLCFTIFSPRFLQGDVLKD